MFDHLQPFEGPLAAIEAARENLADFEARCKAFIAECNYEVVRRHDAKTDETVVLLKYSHRPPAALRARATSILSDTRHALDQAVCDAAVKLGRKNAKGVYFPVGKDAIDLEAAIASRCKDVHPEVLDFIRACKPYYGGNDVVRTASSLATTKHSRVIQLSLGGKTTYLVSNENLNIRGPFKLWTNKWSRTSNELEYARIGPGGHFQMDIKHPVEVILGEGDAPFDGDAATALSTIIGESERIILGLKAETLRILRRGALSRAGIEPAL